MVGKRSPADEIKRELALDAARLKRGLTSRYRKPANLLWHAGEIHAEIRAIPPRKRRTELLWELAITYWAARRRDLALRAVKLWRGDAPETEADRAMLKARADWRRVWESRQLPAGS